MKGILNSELRVTIKGEYRKDANVLLVIPALKVFQRGGLLKDKDDEYGFLTDDGLIPLPQNVEGYILVMGDYRGQVVFGKLQWTISQQQHLTIQPAVTTIFAANSKNADQIRATDKVLAKLDSLRPVNCNCHCGVRGDTK